MAQVETIQRGAEIPGLHGEVLYDPEEVGDAITRLGIFVLENYPEPPLSVGLLNGAGPLVQRVMSRIATLEPSYHPPLDHMIVSTYHSPDPRVPSEPRIVTDLSPKTKVADRQVLIWDDILDTGKTIKFTKKHLETAGAAQVDVAVLVDRMIPKEVQAEIAGFRTAEKRWLVGMGMDDSAALGPDGGRFLPYIAVALSQPEGD